MTTRSLGTLVLLFGALLFVAVPAQAAPPAQTDVLIVFDTTGSMNAALSEAQGQVDDLMSGVSAQLPDVHFGIGEVKDYPDVYGEDGDQPWTLDQPLTADPGVVESAVDNLTATGGGDAPEAYGRGLWEATNSPAIGWRPGARKLIVLVADNVPHDDDLNQGIPDSDQAFSSPWDTGADPGPDGIVGTADDIDWQTTLGQMVSAGIQVFTVFYHGNSDYLPYWDIWTQETGGTVTEPVDDLDDTIVTLVSNGANSELPACPAGQSRSSTTGQCGTPPNAPVLAPPAVVGTAVNVAWSAATGAATYSLVVDGVTVQSGLTSTSAQLTGVAAGSHGLRVVATNPFGATASAVDPFALVAPVGLDGAAALSFIHRYGFGFQNVGLAYPHGKNTGGRYDTWPAWVLTYGSDVMYDIIDESTGQFLADPDATAAFNTDLNEAKNDEGGQCLGFSFSSSLRIAHPGAPMFPAGEYALTDRFTSADDTAFSPVNILGAIHGRFTIQEYGRDYLNWQAKWQATKLTAASLRQAIEKYLRASPTTYPVLNYGKYTQGDYEGHSVIVTGIRDRGAPENYDILTLDSNIVDGSGVTIEVRSSYWDTDPTRGNASFFPARQNINSMVLGVVPPSIAGAVQPVPNWSGKADKSALAVTPSTGTDIVIHANADVKITQLSAGAHHLFDATGEVDTSSAGIAGASLSATESGALLIQLPSAGYVLNASTTTGGEVLLTRGGRTTTIDLPASPKPVELVIPADDSGPIDAEMTGTATMTVIQRLDKGDFRIAAASGSARLGLGIADNGTLSVTGAPHKLRLSTLGPHYPESTVGVDLPAGTRSVHVIWQKLATASVAANGKGGKSSSLKVRKTHLVRSVKLAASRSRSGKLTVSLHARTSAPANVTVRLTLLKGSHVVRRWRGAVAQQTWKLGHIGIGSYSVAAAVGATSTTGRYAVETTTAKTAVRG